MNGVEQAVTVFSTQTEAAGKELECPGRPPDYIEEGIMICGACHTPKQTRISILGRERVVYCLCKCGKKEAEERSQREQQQQRLLEISQLRSQGIQDRDMRNWKFDRDDGRNARLSRLSRRYADQWGQMNAKNIGLLLYGQPGVGKTFYSACISNALIDRGVSVLMTSFPKIVNALDGMYSQDRNRFLSDFSRYGLLVADDLGAERNSETAQAYVYSVIDNRYRSGRPMIITTNLSLRELKDPCNMGKKRIYERILEMSVPLECQGENRREQIGARKIKEAAELLMGG